MNASKSSVLALLTASLVGGALACSADATPGAAGPPGAQGAPGKQVGPDTPPSVNLVTPNKGVLDREVEVSIGGAGTAFDASTKPDFGEGIAVLEVTPSSPTLVVARIRIGKSAAPGPRSVRVGAVTATDAFTVVPAIDIASPDGTVAVPQGGLVQFDFTNNDVRAFDPNAFKIEAPGLIDLGSRASGPQAATGFLLAAPLAPAGKIQIEATNRNPDGTTKVSFASGPQALEVEGRAPTALALGAGVEQTFAAALDTKLLEVQSSQIAMFDFRVQVTADASTIPLLVLFGKGGTKDHRLGQILPARNPLTGQLTPPPYDLHLAVPVVDGQAYSHYLVLSDLSGAAGTKATVSATRVNGIASAEAAGAHGQASPQAVDAVPTSDARVLTALLGGSAEVDAYQLTVDGAAGLQIAATSTPDLEIIVTKDANVLADPQGTPAANRKVLATMYSGKEASAQRIFAPPGTGTLYVVVRHDTDGTVATGPYTLGVRRLP